MQIVQIKDKHGKTKYRYRDYYKDPYTNKRKSVSVVLNKKGNQSQKEAQRLLNDKIKDKLQDNTPKSIKALTFHAACDEWLSHYKNHSGAKPTTVKEKVSNISTIKNFINEDILISKIDHSYLQKIINEWGKNYGYGHVQSLVIVLRSVFKYAFKYFDLSDVGILNKIEIPKRAKTREEIQAKRKNYLEEDEITELLSCFDYIIRNRSNPLSKRNANMVKNIIQFQINNGMRIGELLAIQTKDIDFDAKTLTIDGTINWIKDSQTGAFGIKESTKTSESYRTIGITTPSIKLIKRIILENKKMAQWNQNYINRDFVFTNNAGSPLDLTRVNNILREAVELSFIDKKITTHSMRHTHISQLAQLGINLKAIQERVGHCDESSVTMVYTHVTNQMAKDMMNKLEKGGYLNGK